MPRGFDLPPEQIESAREHHDEQMEKGSGCIWCDGGIKQWIESAGRSPEHLISDLDHVIDVRGHAIVGNFVPCTRKT